MKILVAGLGSIGRRHAGNMRSLGFDDLILLRSGKATTSCADLPAYPTEESLDIALRKHQPDLVVVSNPTALHMAVALPAARAGCQLFIEKPVSNTMDGISELEELTRKRSLKVTVGFHLRFHPGLLMLRHIVLSGELGSPLHVRAHWGEYLPNWHPREDYRTSYASRRELGGGVLLTLSHPFDYLRWIFGEVSAVHALTAKTGQLETDTEDVADVLLHFQSGLTGAVHVNYVEQPAKHQIAVHGSRGWLRLDFMNSQLIRCQCRSDPELVWTAPPAFDRNFMFIEEFRQVLGKTATTHRQGAALEDGIAALRIALAAKTSAESGMIQSFCSS